MLNISIKEFIENNLPEFKDHVFPLFTTDIENMSIVYILSPITGGIVRQSNLELKIIYKDLDETEKVKEDLINIFDTTDQENTISINNDYFTGSLSGGGTIFRDDLQLYENTIIFILKHKS